MTIFKSQAREGRGRVLGLMGPGFETIGSINRAMILLRQGRGVREHTKEAYEYSSLLGLNWRKGVVE